MAAFKNAHVFSSSVSQYSHQLFSLCITNAQIWGSLVSTKGHQDPLGDSWFQVLESRESQDGSGTACAARQHAYFYKMPEAMFKGQKNHLKGLPLAKLTTTK